MSIKKCPIRYLFSIFSSYLYLFGLIPFNLVIIFILLPLSTKYPVICSCSASYFFFSIYRIFFTLQVASKADRIIINKLQYFSSRFNICSCGAADISYSNRAAGSVILEICLSLSLSPSFHLSLSITVLSRRVPI